MNDEIEIRPATADCVHGIISLLAQTVPSCSPQTVWDAPWRWQDYWVAQLDGEIVGTAALNPLDDHRNEIRGLAVAPAARGRGVARRFVEHLVRLGATRAQQTVCITRTPAFFERLGFEKVHPFWLDLEPPRRPMTAASGGRVPMAHPIPKETAPCIQAP